MWQEFAEQHVAPSADAFKARMISCLADPATLFGTLEGLSKLITVVSSADKQVKFYSWDTLNGGTWAVLNSVAQFIAYEWRIRVQVLSSPDAQERGDYTDSIIYEVHNIDIDGVRHYLTFGFGTHGSGEHHRIARIFRIEGDKIVDREDLFEDVGERIFAYSKAMEITLAFDPRKTEITCTLSDRPPGKTDGPVRPTSRLRLIDGKFRKVLE